MKTIKTSIIPSHPIFAKVNAARELNLEAICIFAATGFFLDQDTYWRDEVVLSPGTINKIDSNGFLIESEPWFSWHYTPREISFEKTVAEFTSLFERIIKDQIGDNSVILPLSGGLDSRSQAVALANNKSVSSYSYSFDGGYSESTIGKKIAKSCDFSFKEFTIRSGYLWPVVEELGRINGCYSDFTHPRQMAVLPELKKMEGMFSLGHWGDVLFDRGAPEEIQVEQLPELIRKKVIKKGGLELANELWKHWQLQGDFETYFTQRIESLLSKIDIANTSAKMRAFKSLYWAPRWTSANLSIFSKAKEISLPYYDDRMCEFICSIPEEFLADRKIQIAYIKSQNPNLAKITWQDHRPFNLVTFHKNKVPFNIPYRLIQKTKREIKHLFGKTFIQRNWELQFLGNKNEIELRNHLFSEELVSFIPKKTIDDFYNAFLNEDAVYFSHPVSILLTLAIWRKKLDRNNLNTK